MKVNPGVRKPRDLFIMIMEVKKKSGQVSILMALAILTMLIMFAMVVNIGMAVHARMNLQIAADLGALTGASMQGRILNRISALNYRLRQNFKEFAAEYDIVYNRFNQEFFPAWWGVQDQPNNKNAAKPWTSQNGMIGDPSLKQTNPYKKLYFNYVCPFYDGYKSEILNPPKGKPGDKDPNYPPLKGDDTPSPSQSKWVIGGIEDNNPCTLKMYAGISVAFPSSSDPVITAAAAGITALKEASERICHAHGLLSGYILQELKRKYIVRQLPILKQIYKLAKKLNKDMEQGNGNLLSSDVDSDPNSIHFLVKNTIIRNLSQANRDAFANDGYFDAQAVLPSTSEMSEISNYCLGSQQLKVASMKKEGGLSLITPDISFPDLGDSFYDLIKDSQGDTFESKFLCIGLGISANVFNALARYLKPTGGDCYSIPIQWKREDQDITDTGIYTQSKFYKDFQASGGFDKLYFNGQFAQPTPPAGLTGTQLKENSLIIAIPHAVFKFPQVSTYYALRLISVPNLLFLPEAFTPKLVAYAAARPFGSRIGPHETFGLDPADVRGYANKGDLVSSDQGKGSPILIDYSMCDEDEGGCATYNFTGLESIAYHTTYNNKIQMGTGNFNIGHEKYYPRIGGTSNNAFYPSVKAPTVWETSRYNIFNNGIPYVPAGFTPGNFQDPAFFDIGDPDNMNKQLDEENRWPVESFFENVTLAGKFGDYTNPYAPFNAPSDMSDLAGIKTTGAEPTDSYPYNYNVSIKGTWNVSPDLANPKIPENQIGGKLPIIHRITESGEEYSIADFYRINWDEEAQKDPNVRQLLGKAVPKDSLSSFATKEEVENDEGRVGYSIQLVSFKHLNARVDEEGSPFDNGTWSPMDFGSAQYGPYEGGSVNTLLNRPRLSENFDDANITEDRISH